MDNYELNPFTGNFDIVGVSIDKLKQILSTLTEPLVFAGTVIVLDNGGQESNAIAVHSVNEELTFTGPIVPDETLLSAVKCDPGWVWLVVTGGLSHELGQLNVSDNILIVSPTDGKGLHAEVLTGIVPIGYQFIGVADPTTNDNDIDINVKCAWLAATAGTYTGLGNVVVDDNEIAVITRVASGGVASYAKVSLGKYVKTSDIADNLETDDETKVLSAKQGKILNEQIKGVGGFVDLSLTLIEDSYYSYNTISNIMNSQTSVRQGTNCVIIPCSEGDIFKIFGHGSTIIKLYAFTDDNCTVLLTNTSSIDWHTTGGEVTAPSGSTRLYINFLKYEQTDKVQKFTVLQQGIVQRIDDCVERIEQLENNEDLYLTHSDIADNLNTDDSQKALSAKQGKILNEQIKGVGGFVDLSLTLIEDSYYSYNTISNIMNSQTSVRQGTNCVIIPCSEGDIFKIFGHGSTIIKLYAFTDDNCTVLLTNTSSIDWHTTGGEVTAPSGSTRLYINFLKYEQTDKVQKFTVLQQGIVQRIDDCVERIEQLENNEDLYLTHSDIADNLNTDDSQKALSAKQGKILNEQINGVVIMQDVTGIVEHTYINLRDSAIYSTGVQVSTAEGSGFDCASLKISCVPGDKFKIWGLGPTNILKLYAFVRQDQLILNRATFPLIVRENGIDVCAPDEAAYLYVNLFDYDSTTDKVQKYVVVQEGIEQRINNLDNKVEILSKEAKPVYKEKVFIAFGDSVTEFAGTDGKRWTDYAEEIMNCHIINCAIGGSHMNDPYGTELFDPSHNYEVGAYVFYKPDTTMNVYRCTTAHSGPWDDNDFTDVTTTAVTGGIAYGPIFTYRMIKAFCNTAISDPYERFRDQIAAAEAIYTWKTSHDDNRAIIQELVDAKPDLIEAVLIAEGTNDYNATDSWGTSGSFDTTTLLGAINESIRLLNSTFKSMKVFYVTPTVRWYNYSGGTGIQSDFSDYYDKNGIAPKTFREYVHEILMNEYINNHVPCVNLYDELQWTMYNFSNYFRDNDGTHPTKGFRYIAQKVASFLISNKNF